MPNISRQTVDTLVDMVNELRKTEANVKEQKIRIRRWLRDLGHTGRMPWGDCTSKDIPGSSLGLSDKPSESIINIQDLLKHERKPSRGQLATLRNYSGH